MAGRRRYFIRRLEKLAVFLSSQGRAQAAGDIDRAAQLVRRLDELEKEKTAGRRAMEILRRRLKRKAQLERERRARKKQKAGATVAPAQDSQ